MKFKNIMIVAFLIGGVMGICVLNKANGQRLRSLFDIQQAYCSIKTNGVTGYTNRDSAWAGRGGGTSSTNAMLLMENGENIISIEIGALGWFSDQKLSLKEKQTFKPQAQCNLELVRLEGDKKTSISSIKVSINRHGIPEAQSDSSSPIIQRLISADQSVSGHIEQGYLDETYYPKDMELYQFTKKVIVSGIPEWKWVNATPFNGSAEQMHKLQKAYVHMAEIINSHNRAHLKEFDKIALKAWSMTTGESEDEILLSLYTKEDIEGKRAKIIPIKWEDYSIRVMNNGRMVQLYNKSMPNYSPLRYEYIDEDGDEAMGAYGPIFSLIEGEFVPVI